DLAQGDEEALDLVGDRRRDLVQVVVGQAGSATSQHLVVCLLVRHQAAAFPQTLVRASPRRRTPDRRRPEVHLLDGLPASPLVSPTWRDMSQSPHPRGWDWWRG